MFRDLKKRIDIGTTIAVGDVSRAEAAAMLAMARKNDLVSLTKVPGNRKKTAERLAIDLRDRLKEWDSEPRQGATSELNESSTLFEKEAEAALVALGYKAPEAIKAISLVVDGQQAVDSSELILKALKVLGSGL